MAMAATVTLAWKHGLVETVSCNNDCKGMITSKFSHLIVIDFESTCWNSGFRGSNEIIEFPAVLIDLQTGIILQEFRHFVTPVENPRLSEFCTSLTGISQQDVDGGIPLKTCLYLFKKWVEEINSTFEIESMALVTWSDWDFNTCLSNECRRKMITRPDLFNKWIDLRLLYKEHIGAPAHGLKAAVENMDLIFTGREHSGIDDARNTARLAWKLHSQGKSLRITKDLNSIPFNKNK